MSSPQCAALEPSSVRRYVVMLAVVCGCSSETGSPDASVATDASQDAGIADILDAGGDATFEGVDAGTVASSGGSGGLPCVRTGSRDDIPYCVAEVAGVELKIVEPTSAAGPLQLAIYLHGDGARAFTGDTDVRVQGPWAREEDVLYVAARAPNGCAWWLRPTLPTCDGAITADDVDVAGENADALLSAIEALRGGWDLRTDSTLLGGSSGGSVFLQASFIPRHGDVVFGPVALGCGGMPPWMPFTWEVTETSIGPTEIFANYGDADDLVPDIEAGNDAYRDLGFSVHTTVQPGVGHCAFDHLGWIRDTWRDAR